MNSVAVTSRSFSNNIELRHELSKKYKNVVFNDTGKTLEGIDLINFLKGHEKIIVGLERLDSTILNYLPDLKVISRFGVGVDTLDLTALKKQGIKLAYTKGANRRAVSELVIAFAIHALRHLFLINQEIRSGKWLQKKGKQLSEKCVGIIGFGAIGKDLAHLLKAFNCNVLVYDLADHKNYCNEHQFQQVDLDHLLQVSDIISLHIPFNESTKNILNAHRLEMMKENAILINTARGGLVDEARLKDLLKKNKLSAAFDVFSIEPPMDSELLLLPNFFGTPHIGGSTDEAILAMGYAAITGLENADEVKGS